MTSYKYLCFDMDGVIFSSEGIIADAYIRAVEVFNEKNGTSLQAPSLNAIMNQIGKPSSLIIQTLFPAVEPAWQHELGLNVMNGLVDFIRAGKGVLMDGMDHILDELSGKYSLLLASNARQGYADAIFDHYGLRNFFGDTIFLGGPIAHKGQILENYKARLNIQSSSILMIGDRSSDRDAALYAGCDFMGVLYGHGDRRELEGARYFAESPRAILQILTNQT